MKKNFKLFCFGFGKVAESFVKILIKKNFSFQLITTNTTKTQEKVINNLKYKSHYFYNEKFDKDLLNDLKSSDKVLISIPPKNNQDIVLKTFYEVFEKTKFSWVTYLSATSVYGDKNGEWVDEKTNPQPTSKKGIARLEAENNWLKLYKNFNLPIQILRLAGIYSVKNNAIKRLQIGKLKIVEKSNHFFSRIHIDDIAAILTISLTKFNSGQIFNISDNYPCSNEEVAKYAANLIKMSIPAKIKIDDIGNKMLKDFYKDSKKVNNQKMKSFFNYNLKYPTFKEGLDMIKNHII